MVLCSVEETIVAYEIVGAFNAPVSECEDLGSKQIIDELQSAGDILAGCCDGDTVGNVKCGSAVVMLS